MKILYPWENIYGEKKCQIAAEDSIASVEELYGVKIDEEELALAEWFEREEMPVEPEGVSLTNEMMMVFKKGLDK